MRPKKTCRACQAGECYDCANWGHPEPWCEHLCSDGPRQLSLPIGNEERPPACRSEAKAGRRSQTSEEAPW